MNNLILENLPLQINWNMPGKRKGGPIRVDIVFGMGQSPANIQRLAFFRLEPDFLDLSIYRKVELMNHSGESWVTTLERSQTSFQGFTPLPSMHPFRLPEGGGPHRWQGCELEIFPSRRKQDQPATGSGKIKGA
jgi:hypothetical protein